MPSYKVLYKGSWVNVETDSTNASNQKLIEVLIYDTESGAGAVETTIDLEMTGEPTLFESLNNSENKFEVICPKRAEIKIFSSNSIKIELFASGGDNRWYVEIYYDSVAKFLGWLSISALEQDFLPDPNEIVLTASCGLIFLSDQPLTDFNDENPTWEDRLITHLAWILAKTGHSLNIVCAFNIREENAQTINDDASGDSHFFRWLWMNIKTFEDDINTSVKCDRAIELILGHQGRIVQRHDTWYIFRVDEMDGSDLWLFTFDYQGNFISKAQENVEKLVGASNLLSFMNDSQRKYTERAVKSVELDFELKTAKETLTNYDFSRGIDVSSTQITPESWVLETGYPVLALTSAQGYIKKEISTDGYETARYLFIVQHTSNIYLAFRNQNRCYIHTGDKINISIDWRHTLNEGGSGHYHLPVAMVRLWGDDGTHWHMNIAGGYGSSDPTSYWLQSNGSWTTNTRYLYHDGEFGQDDLTQWQTTSGVSAPAPVTGMLEIFFVHNFKADTRGKAWSAVTFEILPYVAGTYQKYKAQQYKVSQSISTRGLINEAIEMSDTIKRYFKGALLKRGTDTGIITDTVTMSGSSITLSFASGYKNYLFNIGRKILISGTNAGIYTIDSVVYHTIGNNTEIVLKETLASSLSESITISEVGFDLANSFYRANLLPGGIASSDDLSTFAQIQLHDVWNQNNRIMAKFEGDVDHLDDGDDIPDLTNGYELTDADLLTNNKIFMALHYRQNLHDVESNFTFNEVYDSVIGKDYTDPTFKYVT